MLRVVLDANVYVSAMLRPEGPPGRIIERFLRDRAFEIVLSPAIGEEVLRALAYPKVRKLIRSNIDPELWFEDLVVLSVVVTGARAQPRMSNDPDDDKFIGAAVEGQATFVVTGDSDLLTLEAYEGIRIVTPRAFLAALRD